MGEHLKEGITPSPEPAMYRGEGDLLAGDLLLFLRYVKDNEPELGQEGALYKRNQQGVMNALQIAEPCWAKAGGDSATEGPVSTIRRDLPCCMIMPATAAGSRKRATV